MIRFLALLAASLPIALGQTSVDWHSIKSGQDSLPDFSACGYHAQAASLPNIAAPASTTVPHKTGNQTEVIQKALDKHPIVALAAGTYEISSLRIPNGTVLRGAGIGKTILQPYSAADGVVAVVMGTKAANPKSSVVTDITDSYVGTGASTMNVKSSSKLKVGQAIYVQRAVTDAWVEALNMTGFEKPWLSAGTQVTQPRYISAIKSDTSITVFPPITDTLNTEHGYMEPQIAAVTLPAGSSEIGLELLSITLKKSCSGIQIRDDSCTGTALQFPSGTHDSWVRQVNITGFDNSVKFDENSYRNTAENLDILKNGDKGTDGSNGYAADITIAGYQILVKDSSVRGADSMKSFPIVTQKLTPGPNAVVNMYSQSKVMTAAPHARWAHGLLLDRHNGGYVFQNRKDHGSGQGWSVNAGVVWNSDGRDVPSRVEYPAKLGHSWCIGCRGDKLAGNGQYIDKGKNVTPYSLFAKQLEERCRSRTCDALTG